MEDTADRTNRELMLRRLSTEPHTVHRELSSQGPVVWVDAIGGWLVLGRSEALAAMRNAADFTVDDPRFTTAQIIGPSMLSTDGVEHQRMRMPFVGDYARPKVAELTTEIRAIATELIGQFKGDEVELRSSYAAPLAAATIRAALGLREIAVADMLGWYGAIVDAVQGLGRGHSPGPEAAAAVAQLGSTVLTAAGDDTRGLDPAEFVSNVAVILFGAIETSEAATANALWFLLTNPEALADVVANQDLVANAVGESMRLEPGAAVIDRYTTRAVELGGCQMKKGDYVSISLSAANRDPLVFDQPDLFDINRSNQASQLTFAQGPHACLGIHLAKAETVIAVQELLRAWPTISLGANSTAPSGLIFRKPHRLNARHHGQIPDPELPR